MKHVPSIELILSAAALMCLGLACDSSTKGNGAGDALGPADATGVAASDAAPEASVRDVGAADLVAVKTDTAPDLTAPSPDAVPDLTAVKPDAVPDLVAIKPDAAPDLTVPRPDAASEVTAIPDGAPPLFDVLASRCVLDAASPSLVHLSPLELKTLLDAGEDMFLINVKGASIDQIPGTDATLVNDIAGIEALVGNDLCANIVLYCQSGGTSQSVGTQLVAKGYRQVRDLSGGITAWKAAGYPTL